MSMVRIFSEPRATLVAQSRTVRFTQWGERQASDHRIPDNAPKVDAFAVELEYVIRIVTLFTRSVRIEEQPLHWNLEVKVHLVQAATALPRCSRCEGAADPDSIGHHLALNIQCRGGSHRNPDHFCAKGVEDRQFTGVLAMSTWPAHQVTHVNAKIGVGFGRVFHTLLHVLTVPLDLGPVVTGGPADDLTR